MSVSFAMWLIFVDFHAEATSEKVAMSWHLDGRVQILYGTHTHVPTADEWVMPKGLGYVSDLGMSGSMHSVIGVVSENVVKAFTNEERIKFEVAENGPIIARALLVEMDKVAKKCVKLERLSMIVAR